MTNSDQLMLAAIKAQVSFKINGREVAVDEETTTVLLHGEEVAKINSKTRKITLYARTRVSRKSTRVFNCILKEFTGCSVLSRDGQWILKLLSGRMEPLGTREVIIPIKKDYYDKIH